MPTRHNYGDPLYWQKRYKQASNQTFDWLQDWSTLKPLILRIVGNRQANILNIGCGNAAITQHMWDQGYKSITNIDTSKEVILQMRKRNETKRPGLKYQIMDARKLQCEQQVYDFILDKCTIDSIYCGDSAQKNVLQMLRQVKRVMKPNGIYFGLSYGLPKTRIAGYESTQLGFFVANYRIGDFLVKQKLMPREAKQDRNFDHYMYFCAKKQQILKSIVSPKQQQKKKQKQLFSPKESVDLKGKNKQIKK